MGKVTLDFDSSQLEIQTFPTLDEVCFATIDYKHAHQPDLIRRPRVHVTFFNLITKFKLT